MAKLLKDVNEKEKQEETNELGAQRAKGNRWSSGMAETSGAGLGELVHHHKESGFSPKGQVQGQKVV